MKIIKAIHANTTNGIEAERKTFSIQSYNIESFLSRQEAEIIEQTQKQLKKILEAQSKPNITDFLSALTPAGFLVDAGFKAFKAIAQ